jgi:hypothetical protein
VRYPGYKQFLRFAIDQNTNGDAQGKKKVKSYSCRAKTATMILLSSLSLLLLCIFNSSSHLNAFAQVITEDFSSSPSISMVPSSAPTESAAPSEVPSVSPTRSMQPNATPTSTSLPSDVPTLSLEPTFQPVYPHFRFKLRLYWQPGYLWQEDTTEKYWCLECVPCSDPGRVRIDNGLILLGCGLFPMPCTNCPLCCCCSCCCFL